VQPEEQPHLAAAGAAAAVEVREASADAGDEFQLWVSKLQGWVARARRSGEETLGQWGVEVAAAARSNQMQGALREGLLRTQGNRRFEAELDCAGVLRVHLRRGRGLRGKGRKGRDAYVTLALGAEQRQSRTVLASCEPDWDEHFSFRGLVRELLTTPLELACYDAHLLASEAVGHDFTEALGGATIDLQPLLSSSRAQLSAPLSRVVRLALLACESGGGSAEAFVAATERLREAADADAPVTLSLLCSAVCAPRALDVAEAALCGRREARGERLASCTMHGVSTCDCGGVMGGGFL